MRCYEPARLEVALGGWDGFRGWRRRQGPPDGSRLSGYDQKLTR
jgi:hypothetical protein